MIIQKSKDVNIGGSMLSKITKLTVIFILILSVTFLSMPKTYTQALQLCKGADVSWLSEMEANGYKFYNDDGIEQDCLQILKDHGIDSIRLRYGSILQTVTATKKRQLRWH